MEYMIEYPSSPEGEAMASSLTNSPIGVVRHPTSTDAIERSPKSSISGFAQATQDLLMEDSSANRAAAARKLAESGKRSATTYLVAALSDSSPEVRIAAAESLGQLGDVTEMTHLRDLLARGTQSETEEQVISEAINSIATREAKAAATPPAVVNENQPINSSLDPGQLSVDMNAQPNPSGDAKTEIAFSFLTTDEGLCHEEAALREARQDFEHRRAASEKLRRAHDEKERVGALDENRHIAEGEPEHRNERDQKLLAELEELRKAEAEQLERVDDANVERGRSREEMSKPAENEAECSARSDDAGAETERAQLPAIRFDAESEVGVRAAEKHRLDIEIKSLSKDATAQIDLMEQASARLSLLEQLRLHAETMVIQRAEREIRLEAEIAALRQAEAAQIKRIEQAEAEAQHLAEVRQRAAAEARNQVEEVTRRLAEEEEQRIAHLEAIRFKAEAAAQERAEKERLINSQLLAFSESAAEQLKRIDKGEADLREAEKKALQFEVEARQKSELEAIRLAETLARRQAAEERLSSAEAQAKQQAQEEERTIAQLELMRGKAEMQVQQRAELIQSLNDDIKALRKIEEEQSQRIEETETRLHQMEADTRRRAQNEEQQLADVESLRSQSETRAQQGPNFNGHSNVSPKEEVEVAGDHVTSAFVVNNFRTSEQTSTEASERLLDPVRSKENIRITSEEKSDVSSSAECKSTGDPAERVDALPDAQLSESDGFGLITSLFDDSSAEVRNGAARALYNLAPNRSDTFTRALRDASPERRRQIVTALDSSGLAAEAIDNLAGESREKTHDAFSLLFLMAKAGEFQLLLQTIEKHPNNSVRLSVIKLLTFCNQPEIIPAFRSLAVRGSLPTEVRSALVASIYEMSSNARGNSRSAA